MIRKALLGFMLYVGFFGGLVYGLKAQAQSVDADALYNLDVDARVIKQLSAWNPKFKTYKLYDFPKIVRELFDKKTPEMPMAVKADFNGDGKMDYAFFGYDENYSFVVIVTEFGSKDHVVEVKKLPRMDPKKMSVTNGYSTEEGLPVYIGLARGNEIGSSPIQRGSAVLFYERYSGANELYQLKGATLFKVPDKL